MTKYLSIIAAIIGIAVGSVGTLAITKAVRPKIEIPSCPDCSCPPATEVSLQNFDLDKLNNKRGTFTYSPTLSNVVVRIDCKDSVLLKQLLNKVTRK